MINALYEHFPETVMINGKEYQVLTDFRDWLRFADMLEDKDIPDREKLFMMSQWLEDAPAVISKEVVTALCRFYRANELEQDIPEDVDGGTDEIRRPPVISWKIDAKYIIGDFLRYYRIDLLTAEMHWWKFRTLLSALPDESQMMKRIAYRSADLSLIKNEAERKRIMRMQQLYALPFELDDEDIGAVFAGGVM